MVGLVDLDLLSQIPQKDARIMGGRREEGKLLKVNNGGERVEEVAKNDLQSWGNFWEEGGLK